MYRPAGVRPRAPLYRPPSLGVGIRPRATTTIGGRTGAYTLGQQARALQARLRPVAPRVPPPQLLLKRKIGQVAGVVQQPLATPRAKVAAVSVTAAKPGPVGARSAPSATSVRVPVARAATPSSAATTISSVEAARKGDSSKGNDTIKHAVKLRKVEALSKQLLDEWTSLPHDKKEEAFSVMASKFVERVPAEYLATMAEQFVAAAEGGTGNSTELDGVEEEETVLTESATAEQRESTEGVDVSAELLGAMKQMLEAAENEPATVWSETWSSLVTGLDDECNLLSALFEASLEQAGGTDLAPSIVVRLISSKCIELKNVEAALQALAGRLEDFVQSNESAWHIHSNLLVSLFPKTVSTTWGFSRSGWTWTSWWLMAEKVLSAADHFRAFDILVMVLQTMQEKSGAPIKKQQVWKEGGRLPKVQKALCTWGELDTASIADTLSAYGVEL